MIGGPSEDWRLASLLYQHFHCRMPQTPARRRKLAGPRLRQRQQPMTAPFLLQAIDRFVSVARESREQKRGGPFFYYPIKDWAAFQSLIDQGRRDTVALPSEARRTDPRATFATFLSGGVRFSYFTCELGCDFATGFDTEQATVRYVASGGSTYSINGEVVAQSRAGDFVFSVSKGPRIRTETTDDFAILIVALPMPAARLFSLRNEPAANQYLKQYHENGVVVSSQSPRWAAHLSYALNFAIEAASSGIDATPVNRLLEEYLHLHFCHELAAQSQVKDDKQQYTVVPLKLKIAENFVASNAARAPSVGDVAAEARLSVRNLHALFVKFRGTSPSEFIREHRLTGIRAALRNAAAGTTVSEIAASWSYRNAGNFAAAYKKRFGELPSETLGQAG